MTEMVATRQAYGDALLELGEKNKDIVVLDGGLGSAVASILARTYPIPIEMIGIDNRFGQSGEPDILFKEYHLLPDDIVLAAKRVVGRKKK